MASWDKTDVSCLVTWITLVDLDQTARGFDTAGSAKMTSLGFWNPGDSGPLRKQKARTIAIQSDNLFRRFWGAKDEGSSTRTKAINAAVAVLLDKDQSVADLAETNNEHYAYHGE